VLLAMQTEIIHNENARKPQCPVVNFETATFAIYEIVELNHKCMKQ
jgi:hypothetical protein